MKILIETIKILVTSALVVIFFSLIEKEKADYQLEATKSEIFVIDSVTRDTIYKESLDSGSGIVEAILKDNL